MSDPNRRTALLSLTGAGLLTLLPSRTAEAAEKDVAVSEFFVLEPLNLGEGFAASKVTIDGLFNQGAPTRDEIVKSFKKCQVFVIDQRVRTKDGSVRFGWKDYPQAVVAGPLHHEWNDKQNKFSIQIASLKAFAISINYDNKPATRSFSVTIELLSVGETALGRSSATTNFSMQVPAYTINGQLVK